MFFGNENIKMSHKTKIKPLCFGLGRRQYSNDDMRGEWSRLPRKKNGVGNPVISGVPVEQNHLACQSLGIQFVFGISKNRIICSGKIRN